MAIDRRDFLKYAGTGMAFLPLETLWESGMALASSTFSPSPQIGACGTGNLFVPRSR